MAGDIRGITIEFNGDTTKLGKALREISKSTATVDKELSKINKGLKFNPTSVELWKQKQELLKDRIAETTKKLDSLKQAKEKIDSGEVQVTAEEYRKLEREIVETESKLKSFKKELQQIGNAKLTALGEKFKQVGSKLQNAGKTLTTKVSAPIAGIGLASLKAGMDFDTAMSQVAATSGKTVGEIGQLRDFAKQMGATTSFSATQAAEGLNYMALAGYDANESMKMLPTVLNLAAAGAMDLGAASDMVTDAQTALGLSMKDTTTMVDQMAKTASTTNTSVSQLGEAILTIGPTAKNLAGGTSELNQVLGLLADNGIKGSEAGTHLRNIMLSLTPQTDAAAAAWDQLGVSAYDADGNLRPLQDTFGDLQQALAGMSSEERTEMLSKMFNKTDLASVNALLDTDAQRWNEVAGAIDNANGSAAQMADTQLDNLSGSLTLLKSSLEGAGISISDVLAPYIRQLADWITSLVTKFNELSPTAQKIIVIIGVIAAAIGPVLVILGVLSSSIGSIISLIGVVGPVIAGLAGPVAIAIGVIFLLITIGVQLYKNWDTIKAKAAEIAAAVVAKWTALKTSVANIFNGIKTTISNTWNIIKHFIFSIIKNIVMNATSSFNSLKATVSTIWNNIKTAITNPIQTARDKVKGIIDKIKGYFPLRLGKLLHFSLPKITIGSKSKSIMGKTISVPDFNISWASHARGGIFDRPTLLTDTNGGLHQVGEAGPEAILPLKPLWDKLDSLQGNGTTEININVYGAEGQSAKEIAEEVKQMLITESKRRRLAWQ